MHRRHTQRLQHALCGGLENCQGYGYHKLVTYILESENGASLRAAGWKCAGRAGGLRWTGKRRPSVDLCPAQMKLDLKSQTGTEDKRMIIKTYDQLFDAEDKEANHD